MFGKVIPRRNNKVKRDDEVIEIGEYGSFVRGSRYYTNLEDPIVPSGASEQAWLQMNIGEPKLFKDRQCTGKWLVFKPMSFVDAIWPILKKSLSDGKLGFAMKASTS